MSATFGKLRARREQGLSIFTPYRWAWSSSPWQPLLSSGNSLSRATSDGVAAIIAADQSPSPGIYELAIAHKDKPKAHVAVYLGSAASLRDAISELVSTGGELQGFLDDVLKQNHVVWVRVKEKRTEELALAARDSALKDYDYAWVWQTGAKARSLTLKPTYGCCKCSGKVHGLTIKEGPPKLVDQRQKSGFMQLLGSKKR